MGKRGPKPWMPTKDELTKIRLYAGLGSTQEDIAALIGKSVDTIWRNTEAHKAWREGQAETIAKVAGTLVKKALSGDTASAIFYLKTQAGWKETSIVDNRSSDGSMTPKPAFDFSSFSDKELKDLERLTDKARDPKGVGEA